jgi:hypothetical protein
MPLLPFWAFMACSRENFTFLHRELINDYLLLIVQLLDLMLYYIPVHLNL